MPTVSIIIPVYNAEKEISKCINSILSQTYSDFELIIVNDGSTDNSVLVCESFLQSDSRVKIFSYNNEGVSAARNKGIEVANGDYIAFVDADDYVDTDFLQKLVDSIENCEVSVCDIAVEAERKEVRRFSLETSILTKEKALTELFLRRNLNSGPCGKLFSRNVLGTIRFPHLKAYEDIIFVKNVFDQATSVGVTNQAAYHYVQNTNGTMSKFLNSPTLDIVYATNEMLEYIVTNHYNAECFYITVSHLMQYVLPMVPDVKSNQKSFVMAVCQLYRKYAKEILKCKAFSWKEKLVYIAFAYGLSLRNKRVKRFC